MLKMSLGLVSQLINLLPFFDFIFTGNLKLTSPDYYFLNREQTV